MNRFQLAVRSFQEIKGAIDDAFIRNIRGVFGERDEEVLKNVYKKSDLAFVCISTTARAISQVPLKIYNRVDSNTWEEDNDNPWNERIRRPNYLTDRYSLIESIIIRLMSDGDVWLVPFPLEFIGGIPASLWVVPKKSMEPVKSKLGHLEGWRYSPEGFSDIPPLPVEEVCHMWFFNPDDPIMGMAPHEAGGMAIVSDYKAAKYNQLFFDQGASAKGVFSTEQKLTEQQYTKLLERIRARGSGMKNAHTDLLLHSGLEYTSLASTHKEMEFKDLRQFDSTRIMQIYGMKKSIISVTDDINRAISENDKRNWWQATNLPLMRYIQEALTFTYFGLEGAKEFRFDLSNVEALKDDLKDKVRSAKDLWAMGFTANEINNRLELGFNDESWRNTPYITTGTQQIDEEGNIVASFVEIDDDSTDDVDVDDNAVKRITMVTNLEKVWKSLVEVMNPVEDKFESKTKKAFFRYRQKVLAYLNGQKSLKVVVMTDDAELWDLHLKPYEQLVDEVDELYQASMINGIRTIAGEMGIGWSVDMLTLPEAQTYLDGKVLKLRGVFRTVQNRITSQLIEGMDEGETMEQLTQRVRRVFNVASSRAATIARTETYEAVNFSRNMLINQSNFQKVQWFTALDEKVRDSHFAMEGEQKLVDELWIVGGASLRYPGDYEANAPHETINCRCIESVVV